MNNTNANTNVRVFVDEDREWAAMHLRQLAVQLLDAPKKDFAAIKTIYGLILDEENQDLTRRKVEIAERQDEREAVQSSPSDQKSLPPAEVKRRVKSLLGKECP